MISVLLRPWRETDAAVLSALSASVPDLGTQFGETVLDSADAAQRFIETRLAWQPERSCNLAIEVGGKAAGNVGISNIDQRHHTAWIYYWLSPEARGLGLAARSTATLARLAFEELDVFRLELGHRTNNPASCRVATRAGFAPEGVERAKLQYGTARFDVETHARLATDPAPDLDLVPLGATKS